MIHLQQPGPRNCGQTCVAMLTGMSVDEVSCTIGKSGPTGYNNLLSVLLKQYYASDVTMITGNEKQWWTPYAGHLHLCRVRYQNPVKRYHSHWVIIDNTMVYDPSDTRPYTFRDWMKTWPDGTHLTSYVTLTRRRVPPTDAAPYLEQLQQLAKRVVWDGDLISKRHRSQLILDGLADRVHGFNFITRKGIEYLRSVELMPDVTQYKLVKRA